MNTITTYRIRAADRDGLWALLVAASAGKARAFAWEDARGGKAYDEARVRRPWPESEEGEPLQVPNVETGEIDTIRPRIATGFWLCEVALVDMEDADLAALVTG